MARVLSIPNLGDNRVVYTTGARPGRVSLIARRGGAPPRMSELLCGSLSGRPVLLCFKDGADESGRAASATGGVLVSSDLDDACFISHRMRVPLLMLSSLREEGDWEVEEIRTEILVLHGPWGAN